MSIRIQDLPSGSEIPIVTHRNCSWIDHEVSCMRVMSVFGLLCRFARVVDDDYRAAVGISAIDNPEFVFSTGYSAKIKVLRCGKVISGGGYSGEDGRAVEVSIKGAHLGSETLTTTTTYDRSDYEDPDHIDRVTILEIGVISMMRRQGL